MLYYKEPYLKSVKARVIEKRDDKYLLDRTILYPGGGGQPADRGVAICNGQKFKISHVGDGWHIIYENRGECIDEVEIHVDWSWRYKMMKLHTAEHAFFRFLQERGAVLGKANFGDESSIVFTGEISIDDIFDAERGVRNLIKKGARVRTFWINKGEVNEYPLLRIRADRIKGDKIRVVEIEGHDTTACKGVHVKNMAEIEDFAVVSFRRGRKKVVKFLVDEEAQEFHHSNSVVIRRMAWEQELELEKIPKYMVNIVEENKKMREALKSYSTSVSFDTYNCNALNFYFASAPCADRKIIVRRMMEIVSDEDTIAVWIDTLNGTVAVAYSQNLEIKEMLLSVVQEAGGHGGGGRNFLNASLPDVEAFLANLKKVLCSPAIHLHGGENGD